MKYPAFPALLLLTISATPCLAGPDRQGPEIEVEGFRDGQRVYLNEIYVDGWVTDATNIMEITCNGDNLGVPTGNNLYFGYTWGPLTSGTNTLQIQARNALDQTTEISLRVFREMRPDLFPGQRLGLFIDDFDTIGNVSKTPSAAMFQRALRHELVQRGRFDILADRKTTNPLQEREIAESKLRAPERTVRTADMVVESQILEYETVCALGASVSSVQDARVLFQTSLTSPDKSPDSLRRLAQILALKLEQEFPLVQGEIVSAQPRIVCNLCEKDRVRRGMPVTVFRKTPQTTGGRKGKPLGQPFIPLGSMTLIRVNRDSCTLRPDANMKEQPQVGDIVVTR